MLRQIMCPFICGLAFLVSAMSVEATPSPSNWRHITLLGANDSRYFLLVTERTLPGSYFSFTDRWFLEIRRLGDRKLMERTLLRAATFNRDPDDQPANWAITEDHASPLDLSSFLVKEKVMAPYPDRLPGDLRLRYNDDKSLSLIYKEMEAGMSGPVDLFSPDYEKPRIRDVYRCNAYKFVLVESGQPDDVGYKQVIIPISGARERTIMELYRMHKYPQANRPPPVGNPQL